MQLPSIMPIKNEKKKKREEKGYGYNPMTKWYFYRSSINKSYTIFILNNKI